MGKKAAPDLSKTSTKTKISFFSTLLLVIGSMIGAGIFFKNGSILGNTHGNIALAIVSWVIASIGVLMIGLTLTEIVSGSKASSEQGIVGWVKTFNSRFLYKASKNCMVYVYLPVMLVSMSYYFVQAVIEGVGWENAPWYFVVIIAFVVMTWFSFTSGISLKSSDFQNKIIMCFKFFPVLFALIIGYVWVGSGHNVPTPQNDEVAPLLDHLSPAIGVLASIPAIFFAFNGFYHSAGLQNQMKHPQKSSLAMALGIAIVSFIYIAISVSVLICCKTGKITDLSDWLPKWLYTLIQIFISIGVLSIVNGATTMGSRFYEDLIINKEIPFANRFINKTNSNRPLIGAIYMYVLGSLLFILCTVIGLFYANTSALSESRDVAGLLSFIDTTSNWIVLFAFAILMIAIIGGIHNRKTNKIVVNKTRIFMPAAWIAVIMIGIVVAYTIASVFVNIGLTSYYFVHINHYPDDHDKIEKQFVGAILSLVMLFIYLGVTFIPTLLEIKKIKLKTSVGI